MGRGRARFARRGKPLLDSEPPASESTTILRPGRAPGPTLAGVARDGKSPASLELTLTALTAHITIVTPVLNRVSMIADALDSVRRDRPDGIQHIVVDGGSTDGTQELLRDRQDIELVTGRDRNLYDAINKGLALARGDIVGLLNSDDCLPPGTLAYVERLFAENPGTPHVTGASEIELEGGGRMILDDPAFLQLDLANLISGPTLTNSRFVARSVVEKVGLFDIRFPRVSDRDWLIRLRREAAHGVTTPRALYTYRAHPGSLTMAIDAPDDRLIAELSEAASLKAKEDPGHDYARWAAWARFRRAVHQQADFRAIVSAWTVAPIGLPSQILRHLLDRKRKLGRRLG